MLKLAKREGRDELNDGQYWYVAEIIKRLVDFGDRRELWDLRIEPLDDFFELKLKGGLLGKTNLRVYFAYSSERNQVVVLKVYKKEEEHQTPRHVYLNLEERYEDFLAGNTAGATVFQKVGAR